MYKVEAEKSSVQRKSSTLDAAVEKMACGDQGKGSALLPFSGSHCKKERFCFVLRREPQGTQLKNDHIGNWLLVFTFTVVSYPHVQRPWQPKCKRVWLLLELTDLGVIHEDAAFTDGQNTRAVLLWRLSSRFQKSGRTATVPCRGHCVLRV